MSFFSNLFSALGPIATIAGAVAAPFTGGSSLLPIIAAGLGGVSTLAGMLGGNEKTKQPNVPAIAIPQTPKLAEDPTAFKHGELGQISPTFGGFGLTNALTPLQQRAVIASQGTQGSNSLARSGEAQDYYRKLLLNSLVSPTGALEGYDQILPVEKDYVQRILGQNIRTEDTRGFLGAATRGTSYA